MNPNSAQAAEIQKLRIRSTHDVPALPVRRRRRRSGAERAEVRPPCALNLKRVRTGELGVAVPWHTPGIGGDAPRTHMPLLSFGSI